MLRQYVVVILLLSGIVPAAQALTDHVAREQDISGLRLGQRVFVDDGTCATGMIKEVSGARMTAAGVIAEKKCVPRAGPKVK